MSSRMFRGGANAGQAAGDGCDANHNCALGWVRDPKHDNGGAGLRALIPLMIYP